MSLECCPGLRLFLRAATTTAVVATVALFLTLKHASGREGTLTIAVRAGAGESHTLQVEKGRTYGLLVSAPDLAEFAQGDAIEVTYRGPSEQTVAKTLHAGDADLYLTLQPRESGESTVSFKGKSIREAVRLQVELTEIGGEPAAGVHLAAAGNTTWKAAQEIELDTTVYAAADDRPYIPALGAAKETFSQMLDGIHWYRFDYQGPGEKLIHINLDILDRDVPVDVALFTLRAGEPVAYKRGLERFEPEKSTVLHGLYKFIARVIEPGTYYLRVMGNHPAYQLQTETYAVPPYDDPKQAIRTAMDYIVRKGDSWHANVPRNGYVALRTTNPVQETRLCIACHPTHFSTRAEMVAFENGYPVRARSSLQFLIERLSNNPRPLYGKTGASWARMIHAPGNVLSRLAYIVDKFDRSISGERRDELYRGIGEYLEMYWAGMNEPDHESNGNLPRISGFEVAYHSGVLFDDFHRRTGESKFAALHRQTEQAVLEGEPNDMLDLAWQTIALAHFGAMKHRAKIDANVETIFSYQKKDGSWAMPFGMEIIEYDLKKKRIKRKKIPHRPGQEGPRSSEFQTYHTIYALARAGVTLDDPRLRKAVELCLGRQTSSGAWQGSPEYKNFDTPFRDTQYAIMALSTLFPGPNAATGTKELNNRKLNSGGWNVGFPAPPSRFDERNVLATLQGLDRHWDRPFDDTAAAIRGLLDAKHVLVRYQAAVAVGRFADTSAIEPLARRLGDPSKIVQRAAAWALRQIASRKPDARKQSVAAIRRALRSENSRMRWGAARIFNQHFKFISEDWKLGRELVRMAWHEPVPAVQMQALQGLYQWWFWDRDIEHKKEIEIALVNGLGREAHPWVRRNFIEAYYNVMDDNVRYLYSSWIVRVKREQDRLVIKRGHRENMRAQAERFRKAALEGDELRRDGMLRSIYSHVLRQGSGDLSRLAFGDISGLNGAPVPETITGPWVNGYKWFAVYDPLTSERMGSSVRAGNDKEPPPFYEDSAPFMNEALLATLSAESADLAVRTMRALRYLRPFRVSPALAERLLQLTLEGPAAIREEIAQGVEELLPGASIDDPKVASQLGALLQGDVVAVRAATAVLTSGKQRALLASRRVEGALVTRLSTASANDPVFPYLVDVLGASPSLSQDSKLTTRVANGLLSGNEESRQAIVKLIIHRPAVLNSEDVRSVYEQYVETAGPKSFAKTLALLGELDYKDDRQAATMDEIRSLLLRGMTHPAAPVRVASLTAVRTIEPLQQDPDVLLRLRALLDDGDREVRNSALAFQASLDARAGREGFDTGQLLDYEYFKAHIQPILTAKGSDGLACVNCHANHTIFKLVEPDEYGVLAEAHVRRNYASAIGVVNLKNPQSSLLVNKPTSRDDSAGIGDSQRFSHGGDLRWAAGNNSPEYRTILRWIQGERLGSAEVGSE